MKHDVLLSIKEQNKAYSKSNLENIIAEDCIYTDSGFSPPAAKYSCTHNKRYTTVY